MYVLGVLICVLTSFHVCQCLPTVQTSDSKCYGTHGNLTQLHLLCPTGNVIAIKDLMVGAKKNSTGCPDIFIPEQHNASCCQETPDDCILNLDATAFNNNYHTACNGQTECTIAAERLQVAGRNCPNEDEYLTVTSYMYIDYYCIPDSDIGKACSADITTQDSVLYLASNAFPSEIPGGATTDCTCSVESDDCGASINVHTFQRELTGDTNVTCDQGLSIFDENDTSVIEWTCDDNTLDVSMTPVSFSYITVKFSNNRTDEGGKFWLGFQALQSNLTLACPAVPRKHCVPSTPSTVTSPVSSTPSSTPSTPVSTTPSTTTATLNSTADQSKDDKENIWIIVIPVVVAVVLLMLIIIIVVCRCLYCGRKNASSDLEDKRSLVENGSIQKNNEVTNDVQYLVNETGSTGRLESEPMHESDHVVSDTEKESDVDSNISEDVHERTENSAKESESSDDSSVTENDLEEDNEHHTDDNTGVSTDESSSEDENEPSQEDQPEEENESEDHSSNSSSSDSEDSSLSNEIVKENQIISEESDMRSDITENDSTLESADTEIDPDRDNETAITVENVQSEEKEFTNDTDLITEDLTETKGDQNEIQEVELENVMDDTEEPDHTEEISQNCVDDNEEKEHHQVDEALPEIVNTFSESKDLESGPAILNTDHVESNDFFSQPFIPVGIKHKKHKKKKKRARSKDVNSPEPSETVNDRTEDTPILDKTETFPQGSEIIKYEEQQREEESIVNDEDYCRRGEKKKKRKHNKMKNRKLALSAREMIEQNNETKLFSDKDSVISLPHQVVKNIYVKEALKESDKPPEAKLDKGETLLKDKSQNGNVSQDEVKDDEYSVDERYSVIPGAIVVKVKAIKPKTTKTRHEVVQSKVLKAFFAEEIDEEKRMRQLLKSRRKGKKKNKRAPRKTVEDT